MRYLIFSNDEKGKQRYALTYLCLVNSQRKNSMPDHQVITDLTRAVRSVGEEVAKDGRVALFELKEGKELTAKDLTVALEGAEYTMLKKLMETTPFTSALSEQVIDLKKFLDDAPKDKPKEVDEVLPDAKPDDEAAAG
jgi:hypothetical protein